LPSGRRGAATTACDVAVLLPGRRAQPAVYSLLIPSVWIVLTWLIPADTTSLGHDVLLWFGVLVTLAGLPAMVALVLVMVVPGAESVRGRDTVVAVAAIALIVVLSYTMGTQHRRLLTCEDFEISGNNMPAGCTPGNGGNGP
jgi:SNF family Na+-dependent transporter